jgi:uncharacterized damage-inducible protein DinB
MEPDQASSMLGYYVETLEYELPITAKVIAAVPEGREGYRPDPVSRPALELAWHIASSEMWFFEGIARGAFTQAEPALPAEVKTCGQVAGWYRKNMPEALAKLKALPASQLAKPIDFYGILNLPAVSYLSLMIRHSVHHRGQLSAYLRAAGGKVPDIYGGSADEPFQPPAQA